MTFRFISELIILNTSSQYIFHNKICSDQNDGHQSMMTRVRIVKATLSEIHHDFAREKVTISHTRPRVHSKFGGL